MMSQSEHAHWSLVSHLKHQQLHRFSMSDDQVINTPAAAFLVFLCSENRRSSVSLVTAFNRYVGTGSVQCCQLSNFLAKSGDFPDHPGDFFVKSSLRLI